MCWQKLKPQQIPDIFITCITNPKFKIYKQFFFHLSSFLFIASFRCYFFGSSIYWHLIFRRLELVTNWDYSLYCQHNSKQRYNIYTTNRILVIVITFPLIFLVLGNILATSFPQPFEYFLPISTSTPLFFLNLLITYD